MRQQTPIITRRVGLWLAAFAVAFTYWLPAWWQPSKTGFGDWQQFLHQWEAARIAIVRFGEWPMWNPFHCGGVMLWGDPQAQAYSPFFPLTFLVGSNLALKLSMTIHMAVGLVGSFKLARDHVAISTSASVFSAIFWCTSGFFAWHLSGGHPAFFPFFFTPWVLIFWRDAQTDRRGIAKLALLLAVTLYEGGVYPFPFFALLLLFDGVHALFSSNYRLDVVKAATGVILLTTLSSAFRLIPVATTMQRYPRLTSGSDNVSAQELLEMLTSYSHARRWHHEYVWDEYGTLIGWSGLAFVLLGLVLLVTQRRWWVLTGVILFGSLMLGDHGPYWPWRLLHHVPVFDSLRVPSRFAVFFTFFLSFGVGIFADKVQRVATNLFGDKPLLRALPFVLLALFATETYAGNFSVINRFRYPPLEPTEDNSRFYLTDPKEYSRYASFPPRGVGNPRCYSGMNYPPARKLWGGRTTSGAYYQRRGPRRGADYEYGFCGGQGDDEDTRHLQPNVCARLGCSNHFGTQAIHARRPTRVLGCIAQTRSLGPRNCDRAQRCAQGGATLQAGIFLGEHVGKYIRPFAHSFRARAPPPVVENHV